MTLHPSGKELAWAVLGSGQDDGILSSPGLRLAAALTPGPRIANLNPAVKLIALTVGRLMLKTNRLEAALLFDLYGELLTEHQRKVWQLYWSEDWSLSEIGEAQATSRAAVHDILERSRHSLFDYEAKLGLLRSWRAKQKALDDLRQVLLDLPLEESWRARVWAAYDRVAQEEGLGDV